MNAADNTRMRRLLDSQPVAALATLHDAEPVTSMVPFVLPAEAAHFIIHVSALATHTGDMLAHPRVSLLVMADLGIDLMPQALPRISIQADAQPLPRESDASSRARERYLGRFPDSAMMFELTDFSIFLLHPVSARLVAGFGRTRSLSGKRLLSWLSATQQA